MDTHTRTCETAKTPRNLAKEMLRHGVYDPNILISINGGHITQEQLLSLSYQTSDISNLNVRSFYRNAAFFYLIRGLVGAEFHGDQWVRYDQNKIDRAHEFFSIYMGQKKRIELAAKLSVHLSNQSTRVSLRSFVWGLGDCSSPINKNMLDFYTRLAEGILEKGASNTHRISLYMAVLTYMNAVGSGSDSLYDLAMAHAQCFEEESRIM